MFIYDFKLNSNQKIDIHRLKKDIYEVQNIHIIKKLFYIVK